WEMWSQLARWQRPSEKKAAPARPDLAALRELLQEAAQTPLPVAPRPARAPRLRGRHVLIAPAGFRFFVVPDGCAALLGRLNRGATLGALARGRAGERALAGVARLAAPGGGGGG